MLKKKLEEKEKIIAEKDGLLKSKDEVIEAKVKVISEQENMVKTLSAQLEANAKMIGELQSEQGQGQADEVRYLLHSVDQCLSLY